MYGWDAGKLGFGMVGILVGLAVILALFVAGCLRLTVLMVQAIRAYRKRHA